MDLIGQDCSESHENAQFDANKVDTTKDFDKTTETTMRKVRVSVRARSEAAMVSFNFFFLKFKCIILNICLDFKY